VRTEDEIWGLQKWAWYPPREAEVDSGGWLEKVEAGHSEAWASKPADLERHWLGVTEDAPEELLCTVQEPGEEAGRPRPQGESCEALRELVFQRGEQRAHRDLEAMTASGRDTRRICARMSAATWRRWRLSNHREGRPARL
jgi:hypothetical protein